MHKHKINSKFNKIKINTGYSVIDCQQCGFIHVHPIPPKDLLNNFYTNHYKDKLEKKNSLDKLRILEKITKYRSILDVGSGDCSFLNVFKKNKWEVCGIEQSKLVDVKDKIKVYNKSFDDIEYKKMPKFGVVSLNFFLEHHPNPIKAIKLIKKYLLKNNGILQIEVPNDFNKFQLAANKIVKKKQWWVAFPDHLNYFNSTSLQKLLKKMGFEIIKATSSFPLEIFILMGENYVDNKKLGKIIQQKRVKFENNLLKTQNDKIKNIFYESLAQNDLGRTSIIFAKKVS